MTNSANQAMQQQALSNAISNDSVANYQAIFEGFEAMGIDLADVEPRVNVFTFHAWKALGRAVKKGQHGVKIVTVIPCSKKDRETGEEVDVMKVKSTTVFHVSQTEAIDGAEVNENLAVAAESVEVAQVQPENEDYVDQEAVNAYEERIQAKRERYEDRATAAKKAATVGTGGISSDDPAAIKKLREELEKRVKKQEIMKAANKAIRSNKTPESQAAALVALGFADARAVQLLSKDFAGRVGFADYELTNNNANIKRINGRIAELERHRQRSDSEQVGAGFTYREDTTENRVMFIFEGKPEAATRDILKAHAFKWSPSRGAWIRQLNDVGIWNGKRVFELLSV